MWMCTYEENSMVSTGRGRGGGQRTYMVADAHIRDVQAQEERKTVAEVAAQQAGKGARKRTRDTAEHIEKQDERSKERILMSLHEFHSWIKDPAASPRCVLDLPPGFPSHDPLVE